MYRYARHLPRGKVDHIVPAASNLTRCGKSIKGMAVWDIKDASRVDIRRLCSKCKISPS